MPIRVLIVDRQPVVRAGLQSLLSAAEGLVVGEADNVPDGFAMIGEHQPDLVLLDARLDKEDGLHLLRRLRDAKLRVAVLVFSSCTNPTYAARASALGAVGYVSKSAPVTELLDSVRRAARGETCWPHNGGKRLKPHFDAILDDEDLNAPLTRREGEVLQQLSFGLSNRDIAEALGISYETAKEHVQNILRKLGVGDRTQAAVWAVRREHGLRAAQRGLSC